MLANKAEATGSMGTDTPLAILSDKQKLLYNYFKQNFAQVTNPAIDPIREETVMSLYSYLGARANLLNLELDDKKRIFLDKFYKPSGDTEKDLGWVRNYFLQYQAKRPENY